MLRSTALWRRGLSECELWWWSEGRMLRRQQSCELLGTAAVQRGLGQRKVCKQRETGSSCHRLARGTFKELLLSEVVVPLEPNSMANTLLDFT